MGFSSFGKTLPLVRAWHSLQLFVQQTLVKILTAGQGAGGSTVIKTSLPPPLSLFPPFSLSLSLSHQSSSLLRDRFYSLYFLPAFWRSISATVLIIFLTISPIAQSLALDLRRTSWIYELPTGITRIAAFQLGFSTLVLFLALVCEIDMQTLRSRRQVSKSICRREELHWNLQRLCGGGLVV